MRRGGGFGGFGGRGQGAGTGPVAAGPVVEQLNSFTNRRSREAGHFDSICNTIGIYKFHLNWRICDGMFQGFLTVNRLYYTQLFMF